MTVRLRLVVLRNLRGWSQAELARRSGVPQGTISRLEAGKHQGINFTVLERLANALEVSAAELIDHIPPPAEGQDHRAG
jgi:transcriptional regulator with XRE-family HTH domain